jgi:8-oxo-dGTP diphosphatase
MHYSAWTEGVGGSVRLPRRRVGPRASLVVVSSGYRGPGAVDVVGAAIVCDGRVLAARRGGPADVRGGWELPGGKVDAGESPAEAVVREVREELGCDVVSLRPLAGTADVKPGYTLRAHLVELRSGEPIPHEHDALRWLAAEDLDDVAWLPADQPFLPELRALLGAGVRMPGGNVGGTVRVGRTVRRATGPWSPAVHALLAHLTAAGLAEAPRVLGIDSAGREALTFLPGRVADPDGAGRPLGEALLAEAMRWLRRYHEVVADFTHPGPWRTGGGAPPGSDGRIVCHHDFAPYNVATSASADGDRVVGVFDWDMCGPGTPLQDLAFAAWNWVPLWRELPAELAASRLRVLADAYGGAPSAAAILDAVVPRIERSIAVIAAGQAAGDGGMVNLGVVGEPARTQRALDALRVRVPAVAAAL